jgi:uncharacterized Fe-S cluster protein YjdI/CDGSH-type Zn-finger protein
MKSKVYTYKGKSITVTFDVPLCTHVAECLRGLPAVFASLERPWVKPDEASPDDVARVIEKCPTGALQYKRTDGGPQEIIPAENQVLILPNGPYYFSGNIELQSEEGSTISSGTRFALCRCGATQNAPACDNSHFRIMFSAPVTLPDQLPANTEIPEPGVLTVKMQPGGPLLLTGTFTLVAKDDQKIKREGRTLLCACGLSKNKPFCDGNHNNK